MDLLSLTLPELVGQTSGSSTDPDIHPSVCVIAPCKPASSSTYLRAMLGITSLCNYDFTANY